MLTIDEICERAQQIPCSPSVVPKALELLNKDDSSVDDLESLVRLDPGLSGAMLKMANSAFFGSGKEIDHISDAIFRLGFQQAYRLVVSVAGGRWGTYYISAYGWEPGDFCRHSFAVAVASRLVAEASGKTEPDLAYTAGMMHDAGKLALAYAAEASLAKVRGFQEENGGTWIEAEEEILGFTHMEITGQLLDGWQFPDNLIAVGRFYPSPEKAPSEHRDLVGVVHAAKHLAIASGVGVGLDAFYTPVNESAVANLGLTEENLRDLMPELVEHLTRLLQKEIQTGTIDFTNGNP